MGMSNNPSKKTVAVSFRMSVEVHTIIARRAKRQGIKVSEYIKRRVSYDTIRKHR